MSRSGIGDALPTSLAITGADVGGGRPWTVRCGPERILEAGPDVTVQPADEVLEANGGALLPGLHDHHLHLRSLAASLVSVDCGPPHVHRPDELRAALRAAEPKNGWIRGIGYHDSVAGPLDRDRIDELRSDVPIRIQDRSGTTWVLNSLAVEALEVDAADHPGIVRDRHRRPTGVLVRADDWIAERTPATESPWAVVGTLLARFGVTGVTDATVSNDRHSVTSFAGAQESGALPQEIRVLGRPDLPTSPEPRSPAGSAPPRVPSSRLTVGQVKIVLDEHHLPSLDRLVEDIEHAHGLGRGVAVHTVTRATLAFTVAALDQAGVHRDDRIEHASVCPPGLGARLHELDVPVVTQPNFVVERGERYLAEVDPDDVPWLYPVGALARWGIRMAGGTDAPFGRPDPWQAVAAATTRTTTTGRVLGAEHRISAARALDLFLSPLEDPGAPPRRIVAGAASALCLLDRPLADALLDPSSQHVTTTIVGGRLLTP